jgi:two-component system sensor histidine kinase KdpD
MREHKEMSKQKPSDKTASKRGTLKIFLGALPGVGKTYKMLSEAHRRKSRGADLVIGLVETHGRPATADLMEGLEKLPLKKIEYRGKTFEELDTEAVIKRHPQWVLVDELAHTNIPGTKHEKRWQSVEEILDAGINVITTVNIQHLESLNDTIYEITGVRVHETVPDRVIDKAEEVELVDLTPEALINRLKRGDIYHKEKITQALTNFFKKGNIVALRELALRLTAEEVDEQLLKYVEAYKMKRAKVAHERVVVGITPRLSSARLIRRGYRLAKRMQGELTCIHVRLPGVVPTPQEQKDLKELTDLTENLGGEVVDIQAEKPASGLIDYVNKHNTTIIVLGQSARSRFEEIIKGSIINRIMRETKNIDIVIVAGGGEEKGIIL